MWSSFALITLLFGSTLSKLSIPFQQNSLFQFDRNSAVDYELIALDRERASAKLVTGNLNYNSQSAQSAQTDETMSVARKLEKRGLEKRAQLQANVGLTDYFSGGSDSLYFGSASIGTPAQEFPLIFDSGSSDLFIIGSDASSKQKKFSSSSSSTLATSTKPWSIQYGTGSSKGFLAKDIVSIGGLSVTSQIFAIASSISSIFSSLPVSGIVGMGFTSISSSGAVGFFENLMANGGVTNPYFGFYLQRAADSTSSSTGTVGGGSLCLGCIDSTKFTGTIAYTPVSVQGYWEIPMDGISLNGATVAGTSCSAAIDTGTSLSYFPVAVAAAFYAQLGGKSTGSTGEYVVPCSTMLSSVALSFSGVKYYINLNDLFIGYASSSSKDQCVLGILGVDQNDIAGSDVAVIGAVFLKSVYSVFSYSSGGAPAVGFATSVTANIKGNISTTPSVVASIPVLSSTTSSTSSTSRSSGSTVIVTATAPATTIFSAVSRQSATATGSIVTTPAPTPAKSSAGEKKIGSIWGVVGLGLMGLLL